MRDESAVHKPVLLEEVLCCLEPKSSRSVMVDANLGEGGHAEAFLDRFARLILLGVEVDREISLVAERRLAVFGRRFRLFQMWAKDFFEAFDGYGYERPEQILFDLGLSSYHLERSGRGFSFARNEPLDMRLDMSQMMTAEDIVNSSSERELAGILYEYGEERYSRRIASAVVRERQRRRITRSGDLAEVIKGAVPPDYRHGRLHPATRSFQALRIAVNRELEQIKKSLEAAFDILREDGRMAVISFHSLEDRIVKHFFAEKNKRCTCPPEWPVCQCGGRRQAELLFKKPVVPTEAEKRRNPASRSAKLRAVVKLSGGQK